MLVMMIFFFVFLVFSLPKYIIFISMTLELIIFFMFIFVSFVGLNSSHQMFWVLLLVLLVSSGLMSMNIFIIYSKVKGLSLMKI